MPRQTVRWPPSRDRLCNLDATMNYQRQEDLLAFADLVAAHEHASPLRRRVLGYAAALLQTVRSGVSPPLEAADVLMLHTTPQVGPGKRALAAMLNERFGLTVRQQYIGTWKDALRARTYVRPDYPVHPMLGLKAGIARYLVERYRPKVIVISTEDTLVPFLRHEAARTGGVLVNIAHSLVFPSPRFAMCDYDYYLVYGRSSMSALSANPARFGDTRVVLAGSLELGRYQSLAEAPTAARQLTYFSSWIPKRDRQQYIRQFSEVIGFARARPKWQVVVRLHPLEDREYWRTQAATVGNIRLSGPCETISDSVRGSCLTLCPAQSTTALDSACLNRMPIILDFADGTDGYFDAYPELLRRAGETLEAAVDRTLVHLPALRGRMQAMMNDNLEVAGECQTLMSDLIADLCQGHVPRNTHFLAQPVQPTWRERGRTPGEKSIG
jgi:hypothetical protein